MTNEHKLYIGWRQALRAWAKAHPLRTRTPAQESEYKWHMVKLAVWAREHDIIRERRTRN